MSSEHAPSTENPRSFRVRLRTTNGSTAEYHLDPRGIGHIVTLGRPAPEAELTQPPTPKREIS